MGQVRRALRLSVVREWRRGDFAEDWANTRKAVLERDGFSCFYCGFSSPKFMHVHHLGGRWYNDSIFNLVTLCPFCHSCLHVGHAGKEEEGVLLVLTEEVDQTSVNRKLLEGVRKKRDLSVFRETRNSLPVEADFGSAGLIDLADMMLAGEISPDGRFLFFPDPRKYDIVRYLIRESER